jgi:hypothetical protein
MADMQSSSAFFSDGNKTMLFRLLTNDIKRRTGSELDDKQRLRLNKTIDHYMKEVSSHSEPNTPIPNLNKEVLQSVVPDYISYLQRRPSSVPDEDEMDKIREDVTSRFETMQMDRQSGRGAPPNPPNFQLSLEDEDTPSSLSQFELLKQQREIEAKRLEEAAAAVAAKPMPEDMKRRIQSDDMFRSEQASARQKDSTAMALRETARNTILNTAPLNVPPDGRQLLLGNMQSLPTSRSPQANPTILDMQRSAYTLPQNVIIPQEDVIKYKENEYNLFIYSADRDWVTNIGENRYNFSVNFDPANNRPGFFGLSPSTYIKFKNISRIELVKVIMSTEGTEVLTTKTAASTYDTHFNINALAYPYLQVHVDELNTNGFGTNDGLNNSFGIISYDAYWSSDSGLKNKGFTRLIPKFLKCQKIYHPTPLATLNKMTIQIQKPDGSLYSSEPDAVDISGIVTSAQLASSVWGSGGTAPDVTGTYYTDTSGEYLWIQTSSWFSQFTATQGDKIVMKNIVMPTAFAGGTDAVADFTGFLQRTEGHTIVDIGQVYYKTSASKFFFTTGSNKVGFSNCIIIRTKFNNPNTGLITPASWGGTSSKNTTFLTALAAAPRVSSGRLLNLSHQVQVIFRVITRDMDSSARIRPDNM